jgi:hypothetical protein
MKHTFIVSNTKTGQSEKFSGYGLTEEAARQDCLIKYVDYQLGDVTEEQVQIGACISKGEGPGIIECEGCSA